jgi:hypothetical protein
VLAAGLVLSYDRSGRYSSFAKLAGSGSLLPGPVFSRYRPDISTPADARAIRLRAIRRLGQMMRPQDKAIGTRGDFRGRDSSGGFSKNPPEKDVPSLALQGIDKNLAHKARKFSALSEKEFEKSVSAVRTRKRRSRPRQTDPPPERCCWTGCKISVRYLTRQMAIVTLKAFTSHL